MERVILKPKRVGETVILPFDFSSNLSSGETISTKVVNCTVYSGVDPLPANLLSGAASSSGNIVSQAVTSGIVGTIYDLLCTITTSHSQTLQIAGFYVVEANLP